MDTKDIGNHIVYSDGRIFKKKTGKFINFSHNSDGYVLACLDSKQYKLHRIVASCFLETDPSKPIVNHKDGNKKNNHVDNLEWCDALHNVRHAFANGLMVRHKGSRNAASKLTEEKVRYIKQSLSEGKTMTALGLELGVSIQAIYLIKKGRNWTHVV